MNSPGHRANVLGDFNRLGVAVVRALNGQLWVTLDFVKGPALSGTAPPSAQLRRCRTRSTARVALSSVTTDGSSSSENSAERLGRAAHDAQRHVVGLAVARRRHDVVRPISRLGIRSSGRLRRRHRSARCGIEPQQSGSWSPWESLGGQLTSAPSAVSWGTGRIDVDGPGL